MKPRIALLALLAVIVYGCATSTPSPQPQADALHGIASWYGEEFAGRTTANGEIFDPLLFTAAHRTLPFGTVLDITNPKTQQSVRVRVNDRGPYIGNRVIDLSYAAAQKIGLIEPGTGEVDIMVVKVGGGEREPPAPMEITLAEAPKSVSAVASPVEAPNVEIPIPAKSEPVVVDRVVVEEQRAGVITRKQVAPDGRSIESVPVGSVAALPAVVVRKGQFVVQVGAFAVEDNARSLQQRLSTIGERAWIDHEDLFRVRIGPFATREQALLARESLESKGISAIIVSE
ncbi:MAG TPA: septal ring lytic transglycosylase RlpA family protein [Thermoanaerobaculia bacterium]|nr:septal ring lytic transglycosylase RlpA family protein [Thermoanaerobaculia bacterium]